MRLSKLHIIPAIILWLCAFAPANAADKYVPLPPHLDGSMMPFDFESCTSVYIPDSLQPVYAAYVARHGSRYLSSPKKLQPVADALQQGRISGTLSEKGEEFLKLINEIRKANEGNWGDLSPVGYREERMLADRLFRIVTPLRSGSRSMHAISSYMPRCVMTMYLLTNGIIRNNDDLMTMTDEGHQYDWLVCGFMADKEFDRFRKDGDWKPIYDGFVLKNVSPMPARSLFTSTAMSDRELRTLTMDIYEVLKANRAAGLPAPTTQWMSVNEYEGCWKASNLQHYLRNTITPVSTLAASASAPLLEKIIADVDRAVEATGPEPVLNAYFGHAETLLPLLSLMRVPGCYDNSMDYDRLDNVWKIQNITPLAANLLILVSRGPSGSVYVSLQLNGRGVRPMPGYADWAPWTALRDYWLNCIASY